MAKQVRVYVPVTTREYARAYGISERTARRRLAASEHTFKVGTRYRTLVPASEYARRTGQSVRTLRRSRSAVRTNDIRAIIPGLTKPTRREQLLQSRVESLIQRGTRIEVNPDTVENRIARMDRSQLAGITSTPDLMYGDEHDDDIDWTGLLDYH